MSLVVLFGTVSNGAQLLDAVKVRLTLLLVFMSQLVSNASEIRIIGPAWDNYCRYKFTQKVEGQKRFRF